MTLFTLSLYACIELIPGLVRTRYWEQDTPRISIRESTVSSGSFSYRDACSPITIRGVCICLVLTLPLLDARSPTITIRGVSICLVLTLPLLDARSPITIRGVCICLVLTLLLLQQPREILLFRHHLNSNIIVFVKHLK